MKRLVLFLAMVTATAGVQAADTLHRARGANVAAPVFDPFASQPANKPAAKVVSRPLPKPVVPAPVVAVPVEPAAPPLRYLGRVGAQYVVMDGERMLLLRQGDRADTGSGVLELRGLAGDALLFLRPSGTFTLPLSVSP